MLKEITQFCASAKMSETTFGRRAVNDPRLVGDLRRGRTLSEKTKAKISTFMENYRGDL